MKRSALLKPQAIVPWFFICCFGLAGVSLAQPLQVRVDRWLEVSHMSGRVTYLQGDTSQPARVGMRLEAVGEGIQTGARSSAVLAVDTDAGTVNLAANTTLRIQQLQNTPSGGRLTRLLVTEGQARFQVRPFSDPDSQMEIETPAGSSAVRGTEFGINVQPNGTTGVATLEGSVVTAAQGQSVTIAAGFQSILVPGQAPTEPVPLTNDVALRLEILTTVDPRTARIRARVDPINLVKIGDVPQTLDRAGRFDVLVSLPPNRQIEAVVIAPSGQQQRYTLAVPSQD
jgi:hypothetical protein